MILPALLTTLRVVDSILTWNFGRRTERNWVTQIILGWGFWAYTISSILVTVFSVWFAVWAQEFWVWVVLFTVFGGCVVNNVLVILGIRKK